MEPDFRKMPSTSLCFSMISAASTRNLHNYATQYNLTINKINDTAPLASMGKNTIAPLPPNTHIHIHSFFLMLLLFKLQNFITFKQIPQMGHNK